jgi:hypothetical protein
MTIIQIIFLVLLAIATLFVVAATPFAFVMIMVDGPVGTGGQYHWLALVPIAVIGTIWLVVWRQVGRNEFAVLAIVTLFLVGATPSAMMLIGLSEAFLSSGPGPWFGSISLAFGVIVLGVVAAIWLLVWKRYSPKQLMLPALFMLFVVAAPPYAFTLALGLKLDVFRLLPEPQK